MAVSLGILFAIIAMVGFGLSNAISQTPSKKIGAKKTVFYRSIFSSIIFLTLFFVFAEESVFSIKYLLIAFVISFIGYIPLVVFYKALQSGKVGIISPIANSSVIFTVLFSMIFFGETLSTIQLLAIVSILFGIVFISLDFNDLKNSSLFNVSSGVPYALITCFLWGLVFFLYKIPVTVLGPILTSFILEFGMLIFSGIDLFITKTGYFLSEKKILIHIMFISLFSAVALLFFNLGVKNYDVSIVAAITFSSPLISTLYGGVVYKERLNLKQYLAIPFIIIGIILISYF